MVEQVFLLMGEFGRCIGHAMHGRGERGDKRTGKPGVLQFMGSQRVGYDLAIEQQEEVGFMTLTV